MYGIAGKSYILEVYRLLHISHSNTCVTVDTITDFTLKRIETDIPAIQLIMFIMAEILVTQPISFPAHVNSIKIVISVIEWMVFNLHHTVRNIQTDILVTLFSFHI